MKTEDKADTCIKVARICVMAFVFAVGGFQIAKIVMGIKYINGCSMESLVPIHLIVSAIVPLSMFFAIVKQIQWKPDSKQKSELRDKVETYIFRAALFFQLVWLIAGSVWVIRLHITVKDKNYTPCGGTTQKSSESSCTPGTCEDIVVDFSHGALIVDWILMIFILPLFECKGRDITVNGYRPKAKASRKEIDFDEYIRDLELHVKNMQKTNLCFDADDNSIDIKKEKLDPGYDILAEVNMDDIMVATDKEKYIISTST